ncbi:MAG: histidine triad nucleotide-binding protein [Gammaproteobacteria bacterium]|nr:histidine triad nucleotide-binding protein [Gammaproteobacteria bacterium]MCP5136946.1 histidine triad nucleotide-binding protein [Gammaproteobacteria bacterium]
MSDCLFCGIVAGRIPAKIVYQDDQVVAFHDINPQAPLHVLIIPREHIATINDLGAEHEALVGRLYLVAQRIAREAGFDESGYRVVMNCNADAGQSVYHIHLHLLAGRHMTWPPG